MITLDKWIARDILDIFEATKDTAREDLNKKVHVMEITNAILSRNVPGGSIKISNIKKVLHKAAPGIKKYEGQDTIKQLHYLESSGKLLLIGPSFSSIQNAISKISSELQIKTLDVGHTAGFGREERNTVLGYRIKQALISTGRLSSAEVNKIFSVYDRKLSKIHMDYRVNLSKSSSLASTLVQKFDFVYTVPQESNLNRAILGKQEQRVAAAFRRAMRKLADITSSPTAMEMLAKQQKQAFLGKKVEQEKYNAVRRGSKDFSKKRLQGVRIAPNVSNPDSQDGLNTIRLQTLINLRLHDQIRKNMGKGRSKNVLNYRTGRFAKSAQAEAVVNRKNSIDIYYNYLRSPYDTFLPGGRLYKPGRDPRRIIGRSIRQLATELISDSYKVNPVLRGKI